MSNFKYRMKDMARILDRTPARIYDYFKEDKEFYYSQEHRVKDSKKGFIYDEEVLEKLKNRIAVEYGVGIEEIKKETSDFPNMTAPSPDVEHLRAELEEIKSKYQALQADFEKVEGERVELLRQNGLKTDEINHLLLLLSQEKAEKQALLPPSHRKLADRLRQIFKRTQGENKG